MPTLSTIYSTHNLSARDRACFNLFGYAAGGLEKVPVEQFQKMFPQPFEALEKKFAAKIPSKRVYRQARRCVIRRLAATGQIHDPWEQLYDLVHQHELSALLRYIGALRRPAESSRLAPQDMTSDWIWSLPAEAKGGFPRQRLRRAAVLFNELFSHPKMVRSNLLPNEKFSPPPKYNSRAEIELPLPGRLSTIHASETEQRRSAIKAVWQVMATQRSALPCDPSPEELRNLSTQLHAVDPHTLGYTTSTWTQYLRRFKASLSPFLSTDSDKDFPATLANVECIDACEYSGIRGLWKQMEFSGLANASQMAPAEILALENWREIWAKKRGDITPATEVTYKNAARRALLRHVPDAVDPHAVVCKAWAELPRPIKQALAPIRRASEASLLRPQDVSPDWVSGQNLTALERAAVTALIDNLANEIDQVLAGLSRDPVMSAWIELRTSAQSQKLATRGLGKVENTAREAGLKPRDLTLDWATKTAHGMPYRNCAEFRMSLRVIDAMRGSQSLLPLLPQHPISAIPDKRRRGLPQLPATMSNTLQFLAQQDGKKHNTLRTWRSAVSAAHQYLQCETLEDLIAGVADLNCNLSSRQLRTLNQVRSAMLRAKKSDRLAGDDRSFQ